MDKHGTTLVHITYRPLDALTIFAILQEIMPYVKSNVEDLDQVHYWTDSPTSQYRKLYLA